MAVLSPLPCLARGSILAVALAVPAIAWAGDESAGAVTEIVVSEDRSGGGDLTGREEDGYRKARVEIGPLGQRDLIDLPYSISAIPEALIEAVGAHTLSDVIKFNPSAQIEARGGMDVGRPQTRGFQSDIIQNTRMDGFSVFGVTPYPMEMLESVEILNGLSGAFYGPAAPAGTFNYRVKRPTDQPLYRLTNGVDTGGVVTSHADVGGRAGWFGYRLNALHGDGTGFVDGSTLRREMLSGAFDFHLGEDTVVEANASRYIHHSFGFPAAFSYSMTAALPKAPDPATVGYGQEFAGVRSQTDTTSLKLRHDFTADWSLTAGLSRQMAYRDIRVATNTLSANGSALTTTLSTAPTGLSKVEGTMLSLNGRAETLGLGHDLTIGTNGYWHSQFSPLNPASYNAARGFACGGSLASPSSCAEPSWSWLGSEYKSQQNHQQSLIVGDTVTLGGGWSVLLAVSQDWLASTSWNKSGTRTSDTEAEGLSPTVGLMVQPVDGVSLYANYADSLQKGDQAPSGEVLAPYRSEQWEAGLKARVERTDLTLALFRIERPFAYTGGDGVFRVQGQQVNHGVELNARGRVTDDLTLFGGVTLIDPRLKDTGNAATRNNLVVGVPRYQANLYGEYHVAALPGLTATMNLHYTGKRAANDTNTTWADGYATLDLGARFRHDLWGERLTWRVAVNNVFDARYWVSVYPSSINGTNSGTPTAYLGMPRTLSAALQVDF